MPQPTYSTQQGNPFGSLLQPQFQRPQYTSGGTTNYLGYGVEISPNAVPGDPNYGRSRFVRTGVEANPYWNPNQQASNRFMQGDDGGTRARALRETYGILDQARYENAQRQYQTEQALFAAGQAQTQGFDRAIAEAQRYGAAGYQEAADLESRLLGETKSSLAGTGLYNSTLQVQASQFALERGMRARLDVDRSLSDMFQRLHIGRAGAQAQTYQALGQHYERARAVNEQSLMAEFNQRMGLGAGNGQRQVDDGSQDAAAWGQIAQGIATIGTVAGWW